MVNKKLNVTKKYLDREFAAKTCFEVTSVEIETSQTMMLLLASKEEFVVLKALASLDKYAIKLEQNANHLFEEGILKLLLPLLDSQELYIKRFTCKLLSELCFLQPVIETLLQEDELLSKVMDILQSNSDLVVKEFSASIIAELTKTLSGYEQLLRTNNIHILISLLSINDPDVQHNCLKIIFNMIQEPYDKKLLTEDASFTIKAFITLIMSEYLAIQNVTLDILYILTEQTKNNPISKQFQDNGGVAKLLAIIKNYEWKDIHLKALDLLGNIYNDPNIAQNFLKDGIMHLFGYIEFALDPILTRAAVEVLAKVAETSLGRKVFAESGLIEKLEKMLREQNSGVCVSVCHCLVNLCEDTKVLQQLLALPTVEDLLHILDDDERGWAARGMAINVLYQILKRDSEACAFVANCFDRGSIETMINQYDKHSPLQAAVTAVNCITMLSGYSDIREKIISKSLISSILHCFEKFEEDTAVLKLAACEALCSLLSEKETRDHLVSLNGFTIVWESIIKHPNNVQFLQSAANFIHLCVSNDKRFNSILQQLGVLNWLLSQRGLRNECPAWEVALETVFGHFLPIKFAYTGRLEITDITENKFYITRFALSREQLSKNLFPIMDDLISNMSCPAQTLYIANFGGDEELVSAHSSIIRKSITSQGSRRDSIKVAPSQGYMGNSIASLSMFTLINNFSKISAPDNNILKYIDSVRKLLQQNGFSSEPTSSVLEEHTVRGKASLIAQFVANQMSGFEQSEKCTPHMLDLHLNEIRVELSNNIVPVGCMCVGMHMERAFLFKVLADRVGLPCCLVRGPGPQQRGWIELSIPKLPPAPCPAYPNVLLRPNHLVDLMDEPGSLFPLNSYEADKYCGFV